jgi:hypothetical protein
MAKLLTWKEFYNLHKDKKPLGDIMRDYDLYLLQNDTFNPLQNLTYDFLFNFYLQTIKNGGGDDEIVEIPTQPSEGFLLQENGDYLLQENGDRIYL